jgi:hypothetical protein
MKEIHKPFKEFKKEFPAVYSGHEALGEIIHEQSGPLPEKIRWLIKIAVSGASGHALSLETHILKGKVPSFLQKHITIFNSGPINKIRNKRLSLELSSSPFSISCSRWARLFLTTSFSSRLP